MAPSPLGVHCKMVIHSRATQRVSNLIRLCATPNAGRGGVDYVQSVRGCPHSAEGLDDTPLPGRLGTRDA
eukprot:797096-Pyramimonas_sp.AAC.1